MGKFKTDLGIRKHLVSVPIRTGRKGKMQDRQTKYRFTLVGPIEVIVVLDSHVASLHYTTLQGSDGARLFQPYK